MDNITSKSKKIIKYSAIIGIVIILISIIILLILKYNVEGETNMPFEITSVRVVSTVIGNNTDDPENKWNIDVIQTNDFYFYIEKNLNYSKEDSINKIIFNNFNIVKNSEKGNINIYKPSTNYILFDYSDEYKVDNEIIYKGSLSNNIASLEISNQGGLVSFSIANEDLAKYISNENKSITQDGKMLSDLGIEKEDIAIKVSFDMIIETTSKNKYKATLNFDLPIGDIIEEGKSIYNKENLNDIIFKRF